MKWRVEKRMKKKFCKAAVFLNLVFGGYLANFNPLLGLILVDVGLILLAYKL